MDNLKKLEYREFLAHVFIHSGVISIDRLIDLIYSYMHNNQSATFSLKSQEGMENGQVKRLTYEEVIEEIHQLAHIFRNGFWVFRSLHRYGDEASQALRNKILFDLFDVDIKLDHPSVYKADFFKFGPADAIRSVLHELWENRGGKWYFKNHSRDTMFDLYSLIKDKNLVDTLISDIKSAIQETDRYFDNQ